MRLPTACNGDRGSKVRCPLHKEYKTTYKRKEKDSREVVTREEWKYMEILKAPDGNGDF